jgi:uncharacterized protein YdaT
MAEAHINSLNLNDYAYTIPSEQLPEKKRRLGLYALALAKQPKLFLLERPQQFLDQDFPLVWSRIHDYVEKGYSPEIEDFIEQKLNDHHKKVKESASQKSKKNKTDEKLLKDNNAKETNNDKRQDKSENIDVKQDKDKGESTDRYKGKEEDKIRSALLIFGRMQERYDNYSFDQIIKLK